MSVIIVCTVPATDFLLGEFFHSHPGMRATLERVVPLGSAPVPYLWIQSDGTMMTDLEYEQRVDSVSVVDETDEGQLVKVEWGDTPDQLVEIIAASDGALLRGRIEDEQWTLDLRFPDQDRLERFHETCRTAGIDMLIDSVQHDDGDELAPKDGLTPEQAETLKVALDRGYFEVPRETTLEELATEFGISDTAVSQRLRRALGTLVTSSIGRDQE